MDKTDEFPAGNISTYDMTEFDESFLQPSDNIFREEGIEQVDRPYILDKEVMDYASACAHDARRNIVGGP